MKKKSQSEFCKSDLPPLAHPCLLVPWHGRPLTPGLSPLWLSASLARFRDGDDKKAPSSDRMDEDTAFPESHELSRSDVWEAPSLSLPLCLIASSAVDDATSISSI